MYNRSISHESNSSDVLPEMGDLIDRIASYQKLPDDVILPASEFSMEGLFFTGRKDRVRCFQCGIKIQDWKAGERARDKHRDASPNCPIVNEQKHQQHYNGARNYPHDVLNQRTKVADENETQNKDKEKAENSTAKVRNEDVVTSISGPVIIKTTNDAINVISTTTGSWFTPRDNTPEAIISHHTDFTTEANRLASFAGNWPQNSLLTPNELTHAGLYFTGPGDRVQCAWCKGSLYNWEPGDTAFGEHQRHFPRCQFVKSKLSELVSSPVSRISESTTSEPRKDQSLHRNEVVSSESIKNAVEIVETMGFSREMILQAVKDIQQNPDKEVTVDALFDAVFEMEERGATGVEPSSDDALNTCQTEMDDLNIQQTVKNDTALEVQQDILSRRDRHEQGHSVERPEDTEGELNDLAEMNRHLKEKTLCKVCMNEEVQVVFLPCRHLTCCMDCGQALRHCPVCRTLIVGTVTTSLT